MTKRPNPNRKPFPRAYLVDLYKTISRVHPLVREVKESYYRSKNPTGFRHDLGALDIFLDNFGILITEQIYHPSVPREVTRQYLNELMRLLHYRWDFLRNQVIQKKPWWGKHYNSAIRRANAGEPRGLLRFMGDDDWSRMCIPYGGSRDLFDEDGFHRWDDQMTEAPLKSIDRSFPYDDWRYDDLIPPDYLELSDDGREQSLFGVRRNVDLGGVILPPDYPAKVQNVRILHPRQSTPDLELWTGRDDKSMELFKEAIRDQQDMGTCVAHAVCVGLDLLVRRSGRKRKVCFSPAWLHCASGDNVEIGRCLSDAVAVLAHQLPCGEDHFPYIPAEIRKIDCRGKAWETTSMQRSSRDLTADFGTPLVRKLDSTDISLIKAHLSAGWVVVATTMLTNEFQGHGFQEYGLPICPLKGQEHLPSGHAWLLVGYEHSDGNDKWKYQGRFIALNSWGRSFPRTPGLGEGICSLPFAMFLTEGLEMFALRFQ